MHGNGAFFCIQAYVYSQRRKRTRFELPYELEGLYFRHSKFEQLQCLLQSCLLR